MSSLSIISCTNRPNSRSLLVANAYAKQSKGIWDNVIVHTLEDFNSLSITPDMYNKAHQDPIISKFQNEVFIGMQHFLFVIPEYNGTFPGILKFVIDAMSIRDKDATFKDKNMAMVGVASGRSGNLRGMDHLTNALNYLGMITYQNKIPISQIHTVLDDHGQLDRDTSELLKNHSAQYLEFCQ